ncbi:hypothetical protein X743_27970 [Mesorhizobium sp. LNHC252B00]|nr:hypothetical protein X743_27970 [Mesorhizobium sp. LNHC252B00]
MTLGKDSANFCCAADLIIRLAGAPFLPSGAGLLLQEPAELERELMTTSAPRPQAAA